MNDEWRKRMIRGRALVLGRDFFATWDGLKWQMNKEEAGFLWDEPEVISVMRPHFVSGGVFVDVGANAGAYSIRAASAGMDAEAFEPNPKNRELLMKNVGANRVTVHVYPFALGAEAGRSGLTDAAASSKIDRTGSLPVEIRTLDSFRFPRVDLLKIDVEGYEVEVVKGGLNTLSNTKPKVLVEVHDALGDEGRDRLEALLGSSGYHLTHLTNGRVKGIGPRHYLWCVPRSGHPSPLPPSAIAEKAL